MFLKEDGYLRHIEALAVRARIDSRTPKTARVSSKQMRALDKIWAKQERIILAGSPGEAKRVVWTSGCTIDLIEDPRLNNIDIVLDTAEGVQYF